MKDKGNGQDYGSRVLEGAIEGLTGGLQLEEGTNALNSALKALGKQAKALENADYKKDKYADNARSMAHTAKTIDSIGRFLEFAQGRADSRPDMMEKSFLEALTFEQITTLQGWIRENKSIGERNEPAQGHNKPH